jgi:hypothetical protein
MDVLRKPSWCRPRIDITRMHDDVARSARKDIPTCSVRYAISAEIDCDLLVALVKTNIVDAAGAPKVRSASKLRRKGSERGANLAVCGYYCTASTAPQRYFQNWPG